MAQVLSPRNKPFYISWDGLKGLTEIGNWVIGGDFNIISNIREKKGGRRSLDKFQEAFNNFFIQSPVVDMEIGNGWFTWNKKRGGEHLVSLWLDRFLVSEHIVHGMGEIRVDVLPATGSNHWPVCLNWDCSSSTLRKPFRFEQFWLEHKEFKDLFA